MQIPILSGVVADGSGRFRASYPVNLMPVFMPSGLSNGYLTSADGIETFGTGPGKDRGGINHNDGYMYRVMGTKFCRVDQNGTVTVLGDVESDGFNATLEYSFDRIAIASNGKLFYYDQTNLYQVTDPNLGAVVDMTWIDGYFVTTDGAYIVVMELNDPTTVNPLKYGSSEADPDNIVAVSRVRNELVALNRYTIETFQNTGAAGFPFQRVPSALIPKGCVGTHAYTVLGDEGSGDVLCFVGSGRNEAIAVYIGFGGQVQSVSTAEINRELAGYDEYVLSQMIVEDRKFDDHHLVYLHLPDKTLVYDVLQTKLAKTPVWFTLTTDSLTFRQYRGRNFVWAYNAWLCGDTKSSAIGRITPENPTVFGDTVWFQFDTVFQFNEAKGFITHSLELAGLPGLAQTGETAQCFHSWTKDGVTWSDERACSFGTPGDREQRVQWRKCGKSRVFRGDRFRWVSPARATIATLIPEIEGLTA